MGKGMPKGVKRDGPCAYVRLIADEPDDSVEAQWQQLKAAFARDDVVPTGACTRASRASLACAACRRMLDIARRFEWRCRPVARCPVRCMLSVARRLQMLLFHLTNHYALLYALREWTGEDGVRVRQASAGPRRSPAALRGCARPSAPHSARRAVPLTCGALGGVSVIAQE
jgi:hypothetical protein